VYDILWLAVAVAILGGLGSVIRFVLSQWQKSLPWGILTSNTLASAVVGFCIGTNLGSVDTQSAFWATAIATGFAGGLSTFSSWAGQTVALMTQNKRRQGYLNVLLNLVLPVSGAIAGIILAGILLK
jgi:CrcB protein